MRYTLTRQKYLNDDELKHLNSITKNWTNRDQLLIQLALRTGARASELLAIRKSDLDPNESTVLIHGLKGSYDREVPLEIAFFNALQAYSKTIPGQRLFPIGYKRVFDIWQMYKPCKKQFKSLRHTFALKLYERKKDLLLVKLALGHVSITNTVIYSEHYNSRDRMKEIL